MPAQAGRPAMTLHSPDRRMPRPRLPPGFTLVEAGPGEDAFALACRRAPGDGAGLLVLGSRTDSLDLAVVLAPSEPLRTARRAFLACMQAMAAAVGALSPPEMPVAIAWPDTLLYDGARLGGGRLAWPAGQGEEAVPDWLVFGAMLLVSKPEDPGLTPESTALAEEGFPPEARGALAEGFARHLLKTFDVWTQDGFETLAARYLAYLPRRRSDERRVVDPEGDCLVIDPADPAGAERWALRPALEAVAWRDPATGTVRL